MSKIPAIPVPGNAIGALIRSITALKQAVEIIAGTRGSPNERAVTWGEFRQKGLDKYVVPAGGKPVAKWAGTIFFAPGQNLIIAHHGLGTTTVSVTVTAPVAPFVKLDVGWEVVDGDQVQISTPTDASMDRFRITIIG